MDAVVPFPKKFGWIVDLDLEGQGLRDTVWVLAKLANRANVLRYGELRRLLEEELALIPKQRPTGYVSGLWQQKRLGLLPRLIAACGQRDNYLSLRGFDRLQYAACSNRSLERVLELTEDGEIKKRLKKAFWYRE